MWSTLAKMLGVRDDQAEDALKDSRRAAEAVRLSRRGFFQAGAVMAATPLLPEKAFSFLVPAPPVWKWSAIGLATPLLGAFSYALVKGIGGR